LERTRKVNFKTNFSQAKAAQGVIKKGMRERKVINAEIKKEIKELNSLKKRKIINQVNTQLEQEIKEKGQYIHTLQEEMKAAKDAAPKISNRLASGIEWTGKVLAATTKAVGSVATAGVGVAGKAAVASLKATSGVVGATAVGVKDVVKSV